MSGSCSPLADQSRRARAARDRRASPRRKPPLAGSARFRCGMGTDLRRAAAAVVLRPRLRLRHRCQRSLPLCVARHAQRRSELVQFDPVRLDSRYWIELHGRSVRELPARRHATSSRRMQAGARIARSVCRSFLGRPAYRRRRRCRLASRRQVQGRPPNAPVVLSVKFIDDDVLAEIASRLQLRNLHQVIDDQPAAAGDYVFDLKDPQGIVDRPLRLDAEAAGRRDRPERHSVHRGRARRLRAARRPGAAATCGAPRRRSRPARAGCAHLALHDPLCGLPNRIFFGERLEEMIEKVRQGRPDRRPSSTSTSIISRTSTIRSAIRSATNSSATSPSGSPTDLARRRSRRAARRRRVRGHHDRRHRPFRRCRRSPRA